MQEPSPYSYRTVYPVAVVILLIGGIITVKTHPRVRLITGLLSFVLAAMPVAITAASLPIFLNRQSGAIDNIDSHLAIWQENRPQHYRYSFQFSGVLDRGYGVVWTSEVRQGEPTLWVQDDVGLSITRGMWEFASGYSTIDDLFNALRVSIETEPYFSIGDYDPDLGYPIEFSWGAVIITDSLATIRVLNFDVLP
jgi:hypothetical protein